MECYNDCIFKYSKLTQWLGFIDIDEFIVPLKKNCLAALILSLIMAVVVAFIGKIEFNIYIKVVIQIMVGGLCYAGLSYLTRNKEFSYILNVGMKHFKKA